MSKEYIGKINFDYKKEHISKIIKRLESIWLKRPELRLAQFLPPQDLYYFEDNELIDLIEKVFSKKGVK